MQDISKIDPNFHQPLADHSMPPSFLSILPDSPYLFGLLSNPNGGFCRMPPQAVVGLNQNVQTLRTNTAGGRLRFLTDSQTITLRVEIPISYNGGHMTRLCATGFDMYMNTGEGWQFVRSFVPPQPPFDTTQSHMSYCLSHSFPQSAMRELLIHFPVYCSVQALQLGLDPNASILPSPGYKYGPIVFYGSSITQGACASRPGLCYGNVLSRRLDADILNLGFSAGALAEDGMIDYLCSLNMQVLICDYDHNAPNCEHLQKTHLRMYQRIRQQRPNLPIIIASSAKAHLQGMWIQRRQIIKETAEYAHSLGDTNLYFIDGSAIFPASCREDCSVDGTHPNDLGMHWIANSFEEPLRRILSI